MVRRTQILQPRHTSFAIVVAIAGCGGSHNVPGDEPLDLPHPPVLTVQVDGKGDVTSSLGGIHCGVTGVTCTATVVAGLAVTLTATPGPFATFSGWSGPCAGTGACTLTLHEDTTATATFGCGDECVAGSHQCSDPSSEQTCGNYDNDSCTEWGATAACAEGDFCSAGHCGGEHLLSVAPLPLDGEFGTITSTPSLVLCGEGGDACKVRYADGQQVTLTATSDDAATFDGWTDVFGSQPNVAHCIGSIDPCTFTMKARTSLLAVYCTSECPTGGVRCSGNTDVIEVCGHFDDDRCREFGPPHTCARGKLCTPAGCADGGIVTATAVGDGQVAIDGVTCAEATCTQGVTPGTTARITPIPAPNAVFIGWSGACTGTGPCTAGAGATVTATFGDRCTEQTLETLGGNYPGNPVALNATEAYWGDRREHTIRRQSRAGGAVTTIASSTDPVAMVADADHIYWLDFGNNEIRRFGNGAGQVLVPGASGIYRISIALTATHLYYHNGNTLARVPKSGGAPEVIATGMPLTYFGGVRIAVDATHVYWIEFRGEVAKVPLGGGTPVQVSPPLPSTDDPQSYTNGIALDADHVYFSRHDFPAIVRVRKNGGPREIVVRGREASSIAINADTMVWAGFGPPSAIRIGSRVVAPLTRKPGAFIAIDASDIYYTDVYADIRASSVYRLRRTQICPL
jgi:hypothetical protein